MAAVSLRHLRVLCEPFATSAVKRSLVGGLPPAVAGVHPPYDLRMQAVEFGDCGAGLRLKEQFGQGPDQGVDAVGRIAGGVAVEIVTEGAHLILERREGAEMMHPTLLV